MLYEEKENLVQQQITEQAQEEIPPQDTTGNTESNQQAETHPIPDNTGETIPDKISARNFKVLKDKAAQAERERDELIRMLQEERARQPKPVEQDDYADIPDDFVEGKDIKKHLREVKTLKKELEELKQRTALEITDAKLRVECPDFNKVLSDENIALFKEEHPDLAATIFNSKADPYNVAKSAYKMIKKLGVYVEDNYTQEKVAAQRNINKIKPSTSIARQGDNALSRAGEYVAEELTPERKRMLWEEVQKYSR